MVNCFWFFSNVKSTFETLKICDHFLLSVQCSQFFQCFVLNHTDFCIPRLDPSVKVLLNEGHMESSSNKKSLIYFFPNAIFPHFDVLKFFLNNISLHGRLIETARLCCCNCFLSSSRFHFESCAAEPERPLGCQMCSIGPEHNPIIFCGST